MSTHSEARDRHRKRSTHAAKYGMSTEVTASALICADIWVRARHTLQLVACADHVRWDLFASKVDNIDKPRCHNANLS